MFGAVAIGAQIVNSAIGMISGYQQMQKNKELAEYYQSEIDGYQREERENVMRGLRVPETRMQIAREDVGRSTASAIGVAESMGARGLGALPQILERENNFLDDVAASYEEQRLRLDTMIAQDDARLQNMMFQEENMDLQALGQGLSSAQQAEQQGRDVMWGSLQQGAGALGQMAYGQKEMDMYADMYGTPNSAAIRNDRRLDRAKSKTNMTGGNLSKMQPQFNYYQRPETMNLR